MIEEHYRLLVERAVDAILNIDENGKILIVNPATTTIFGYESSELIGQPLTLLMPESSREPCKESMQPYVGTGQRHLDWQRVESIGLRKNGEEFPLAVSFGEVRKEGHSIFTGFIRDITERKRAEEAIRESEDRYRDLVEHSTDLICTYTLQGRLLSVNELPAKLLGYSREEVLNKPMRDFLPPEARAQFDESLLNIQRDGFVKGLMVVLTKTGERRIWEYHNTLRTDGVSAPIVRGIAHDVTERKRLEEALRRSEAYLEATQKISGVGSWVWNTSTGEIVYWSQENYRIWRIEGAITFEKAVERIHPEDRPVHTQAVERAIREKTDFEQNFRIVLPDGSIRFIHSIGRRVISKRNGHVEWIGAHIDVTERKRADEKLRQAQARIESVLSSVADIHILFDRDWHYLYINEAAVRAIGLPREQILGYTLWELYPQIVGTELARRCHRAMDEGIPATYDFYYSIRDTWFENHVYPTPEGLAVYATDITERKRAEEKLREYEKVVEGVEEMIAVVDREYRYLIANSAFLSYRSMVKEQVVGHLVPDVLGKEVFERVIKRKMDECFEGRAVKYEVRYKYPEIGERDISVSYFPIEGALGTDRVACVLQDITERKRAEQELRRLSGQLLRLQDEERRKIARDLHDAAGQDLVALATILAQLHASVPSSGRKSRKLISQCQAVADRCIRGVRTLSYLLHPPMLDEAGLEDAIRHYAGGFAERTGIEVELEVSPRFGRMKRDVELALFRVMQESLINIQRHSGSFTAKIRLERKSGVVSLEVSDKGRGTSGTELLSKSGLPFEVGVGIPSMQERVKLIGGRLEIESSSGGTTVRVMLPIGD
jgi:PAS domain S-box-containing protein